MNRTVWILIGTGLLLLSGCTTAAPTPTPIPPTATPTPSPVPSSRPPHPDNLIPATQKRQQMGTSWSAPEVVYTLPNMDAVQMANVRYSYRTTDAGTVLADLTVDVYYPPGFDFGSKLPVVIFVNGFDDKELPAPLKDHGAYISWGQLTAVSGMIAVVPESRVPDRDVFDLLGYLTEDADWLGVDPTRILLWSCSSNCPTAVKVLEDTSAGYQEHLRGAVFCYGDTQGGDNLPPDVPLLVVRCGKDYPAMNESIDKFVVKARAQNIPLQLVTYDEGVHGFDFEQDTDKSREIVAQVLAFMKQNLLGE